MASRQLTYVKAFNEGVAQVMRADSDVCVIGEDVAGYGGVFKMFDGLLGEFGDMRVKDTPISEMGFMGLGVGAAARGLRPICDLMFMDFMGVCMDQVYNQAAKMKFMFGGTVKVPLTITTASGAGLSGGAQHSQSLEAWFAHVPGLKVVMPATPADAKALTIAAVRDDNPTIVMLNKALLGSKGEVPEEIEEVPLGKAATVRSGKDVTIVESASRTNRIIVVHEAVTFGGIGAEVSSQVQEQAFDYLDAPVLRIGAPFTPVPFSPVLERAYVPDRQRIADGARRILERS